MSTTAPGPERPVRGSRWSDDQSRAALQSIVETLAEASGFDVAGVSAVRDDGYLHRLCLVGPDEARERLLDSLAPVEPLVSALEHAEDWGAFKFVPHDRHGLDIEHWGWTSSTAFAAGDDAWHPENLLVAPLHGADGQLIAVIGLDEPRDGRVPDAATRATLQTYADHVCRAVVATLERERLAEQVRLAAAAADIVRRASASMAAGDVLAECAEAVVEGFRAQSLWTQLLGEQPRPVLDEEPVQPDPELVVLLQRYAEAAWTRQDVGIFAPDRRPPAPLTEAELDQVLGFMGTTSAGSLLLVPLGDGQDCLGWIGMSRGRNGAEWSQGEAAAALDIGRDLGRALVSARMYEREHQLVTELQELAAYKTHLVATVSHELRTPLTSIVGYLEMVEADPHLTERSRKAIAAMQRGSARLARVVEELLVLHRTTDSVLETQEVVDLNLLTIDVAAVLRDTATQLGVDLIVDLPEHPMLVAGSRSELHHVVANLISNGAKYTPAGGMVTVTLTRIDGAAVLTCADTGIGMSPEDAARAFDEFYRSSDPTAATQAGTGLGLAIVRRLVQRHGGSVAVESKLGSGSTFRVELPLA